MTTPLQEEVIHWIMKNKADDQTADEFFLDVKKSYEAGKAEKKKIEYLAHIGASIQPDPIRVKLCRAGCLGRGYRYIDVSLVKGEIHYKIDLCCGVVGASPFAMLDNKLMVLVESVNFHSKALKEITDLSHSGFVGISKMLEQHDSDVTFIHSERNFMIDKRHLAWNAQGIIVYKSSSSALEGDKGVLIENSKILDLLDRMERDKQHTFIKRKLGDVDGIPGVVMLEINNTPNVRNYQVFCSWMPCWHIQHLDCCLDISYQDDGRGQEQLLSVIVRKRYKKCVKSITKVLGEIELQQFTSSINIKKMAEDALAKMDSQNLGV